MRKRGVFFGMVLFLLLFAGTAAADSAASDDVPRSRFFIAPYGWMMGLNGTVGAMGIRTEVDSGFSEGLDKVDFAGMIVMEAAFENKYGVMANLNMVKLKDQASYRGVALDGGTHMFFGNFSLFYRLASYPLKRHPDAYVNFDILAGINYWDVGLDLTMASPYLGSYSLSKSADWIDPVFGARMQVRFDDQWTFVLQGHLGGGGDTRSTWDAIARVGRRIGKNSTLVLGYRAVSVNREEDNGFVFKTTLHGPILGFIFSF